MVSAPATAQTAPTQADDETPAEIIVTARLREETLIEAPLSITAFSANQLENRQIDSLRDLATLTPGLGFEQAASNTSSRPVIRGQSQLGRSSGDTSNVGIFTDGVYSPGLSGTELGFVGIERIEVVRGPQAALYGRNTFAGAINYITKRPTADLSVGARASYGEQGFYEATGFVSAPIVDGVLGFRIDGGVTSSGGKFRNSVNGQRLNDTDAELVRVGVKMDIGDKLDIFISAAYAHDKTSHASLFSVPDLSPRRVGKPATSARTPVQLGRRVSGRIDDYTENFSYDPRSFGSERSSRRVTGVIEYDFGPVMLVSRTGYEARDVKTLVDLDTMPAGTNLNTNPLTVPALIRQTSSGDIEDRYEFSEDLRLQASNPERFDWTIGGYFSSERNRAQDVRFADPAFISAGVVTAPAPVDGKPSVDQEDLVRNTFRSIYGSLAFGITEQLKITAEGRYTSERKRLSTLQNNFGSDRFTPANPQKPPMARTFKYFTPRVILSFQPTRDYNFYASAAKGTKSGGFNPTAFIADEMTFRPESNWTYEIGAKADLLDRKLQLTAAVYQIDWTNQQLLTFATLPPNTTATGDTSIVTNVAKSRVRGFEGSLNFVPVRWLSLNASYAYTDAKYKDAVTSSFAGFVDCAAVPRVQCVNGVTTGNISGNQLQFSPKHQGVVGGEVTLPVGGDWSLYGRADYTFSSKKFVDAGNVGFIPYREELRLRVGAQTDKIKAQAFCDNVTNDKTPLTAFESRDFAGNPHYYVRIRPPRQCGVTASFVY